MQKTRSLPAVEMTVGGGKMTAAPAEGQSLARNITDDQAVSIFRPVISTAGRDLVFYLGAVKK
jgi:hypothetical protein